MAVHSAKGTTKVNHRALKEAEQDEKARISELLVQLKADFLVRDAVRFPKGWRLPK
jgi:hypothetical protein